MDCQMPNLDGYQATAQIRSGEQAGRHTPIVAMTAHAFEGDRERCLRAGMDDYLSKPLRVEDLEAVLERWLARPASAGEVEHLVDGERARSVLGVSPQLAERLLEVFARTTPPLLDELRAAVERGEAETARKLAHKLRSSTETVGAQRLTELARQVELGEGAEAAVASLDRVYRSTLGELEQLAGIGAGGSASTAG
jgi:DNA-binding response OmpR family regulator